MGLGAGQKLRGVHEDGMRRLMRLLTKQCGDHVVACEYLLLQIIAFLPNIRVVGRPAGRRSKPDHHLACKLRLYSKLVSEC